MSGGAERALALSSALYEHAARVYPGLVGFRMVVEQDPVGCMTGEGAELVVHGFGFLPAEGSIPETWVLLSLDEVSLDVSAAGTPGYTREGIYLEGLAVAHLGARGLQFLANVCDAASRPAVLK